MAAQKQIHSIVLDTGPILTNIPSLSSLLAKSEQIVVTPSVISEIKDVNARSRLEMTLLPLVAIREPNGKSIHIIREFARKTGDLLVLSKTDIDVLSLTYELEIERNGGDWRLRSTPGQQKINGSPPKAVNSGNEPGNCVQNIGSPAESPSQVILNPPAADSSRNCPVDKISHSISTLQVSDSYQTDEPATDYSNPITDTQDGVESSDSELSGSEGWITPSNIQKISKDLDSSTVSLEKRIQVACLTTDFAMQNVLLQMGLNLISPSMQQVRHIKHFILRCHACFQKTKDMTKQFCPRCGKPTLTRVSCSTNAKGEFKIHLKKNMQWNHRGDRFSMPKPVSGAANGKVGQGRGGGKGGWGQELILAEDQKEYVRAMSGQNRKKEENLMDEDYLPSILTGERGRAGGRPKIGGGRNVNSKKR